MSTPYLVPRDNARLVVFDFDHTLYDGDSGSHLFAWLIKRNPLRLLTALLATPLLGPLVALLPTRRHGISGYVWIATFGLHGAREFNTIIDQYVRIHEAEIRTRLLPQALDLAGQIPPGARIRFTAAQPFATLDPTRPA